MLFIKFRVKIKKKIRRRKSKKKSKLKWFWCSISTWKQTSKETTGVFYPEIETDLTFNKPARKKQVNISNSHSKLFKLYHPHKTIKSFLKKSNVLFCLELDFMFSNKRMFRVFYWRNSYRIRSMLPGFRWVEYLGRFWSVGSARAFGRGNGGFAASTDGRVTTLFSFNPSVPNSLICVGARMRQIGAYWPLRRDCARLGHRRMLW